MTRLLLFVGAQLVPGAAATMLPPPAIILLMPKTQQFIKGVKGVRFTRLKQQIFFTYEHSMMTVGTMGRPYKAIYLMH